jgi:hypothetical protein
MIFFQPICHRALIPLNNQPKNCLIRLRISTSCLEFDVDGSVFVLVHEDTSKAEERNAEHGADAQAHLDKSFHNSTDAFLKHTLTPFYGRAKSTQPSMPHPFQTKGVVV